MRSCRTASVFAMGVVAAVMSAAACRDALSPTTTVSADVDVQSPELYLGRLEGTAPVAEHCARRSRRGRGRPRRILNAA